LIRYYFITSAYIDFSFDLWTGFEYLKSYEIEKFGGKKKNPWEE
jgi:hypothetical protein